MKCVVCAAWALLALPAVGQHQGPDSKSLGGDQANAPVAIPVHNLQFSASNNPASMTLSPVTSLPVCNSGGTLFLEMFDPKDFKKQTLVSFHEKGARIFELSAITDVHDTTIFSFFPSASALAVLIRGSKAHQVAPGSETSPAGYPWDSYKQYAAIFDLDGRYKESVELNVSFELSRLGILPSGEILAAGYDKLNSVPRLSLFTASGDFMRNIDAPIFREFKSTGTSNPVDASKDRRKALGDVVFTPSGDNILVWKRSQAGAVLVVGAGGSMREVPLQTPDGYAFVEFVPTSGRWIAHYRSLNVPSDSPFTAEGYSYFELRPQDASVSNRLLITGDVPQYIACEANGNFITYKVGADSKLLLYSAQ